MNPRRPFEFPADPGAHRLITGEQGFLDAALATRDENEHESETVRLRRSGGGLRCGAAYTPPADYPHASVARNSRNAAEKCLEFLMGI